jgi:hypothetical protein
MMASARQDLACGALAVASAAEAQGLFVMAHTEHRG